MMTINQHPFGKPRFTFGPKSIEVGRFLVERRRDGDHVVEGFEAVHEAFPGLSFFDFMGGFILADCIEGGPEYLLISYLGER
jgi:hypothetical protein